MQKIDLEKQEASELIKTAGNIGNPLLHIPLKKSLAFERGMVVATFSRASTATYVDRYGVVRTAAIDGPRFESKGLLMEGESTNLLTRSEEFDHADWVKTLTTVTANDTASPDGNTTADKLEAGATGNMHVRQDAAVADPSGKTYAFSVWLKGGDGITLATLYLRDGAGTNFGSKSIVLTSEWQRFDLAATCHSAAAANVRVYIVLIGEGQNPRL